MRKICFTIMFVCLVSFLGACENEKIVYEDTYIAGQDFQYMYYGNNYEFGLSMAETEEGYYKLWNNYIYFIEKDTKNTVPLCGKLDCLHEEEEGNSKKNCNAYVYSEDGYLYYFQNQLYVRGTKYDEENKNYYSVFYEISLDGSKKDIICTIKEESINMWIVHRGKIYYTINKKMEDEKEHIVLKSIDLLNHNKKETLLSFEDIYSGTVQEIQAYGNYVYLYIDGFKQDITQDLSVDWAKNWVNRWICLDIRTGEEKELFTEQKEDGKVVKMVQTIRFWQDCLWYSYYNLSEEKEEGTNVYTCNLDGTNKKEWMKLEDSNDCFTADEEYFYVYNTWRDGVVEGSEEPVMWIYDKNGKQIDTATIQVPACTHFAPGSKDSFWQMQTEEDVSMFLYLEKGKIGTHNGEDLKIKSCYEVEEKEAEPIEME